MNEKPAAVVCLSGGMDSTALMLHLLDSGKAVYGLSFLYGQRHAIEIDFLRRNLAYLKEAGIDVVHRIVDLSDLAGLLDSALIHGGLPVPLGHYESETMMDTVVPNRNAIFSSIAFGWALSIARHTGSRVQMALGVHSGDHAIYPDCRPGFYEDLWRAFQSGNWGSDQVELCLPYLHFDKADILRDAQRSTQLLGLDFDRVFSSTVTSYLPAPDGTAHGLTGSDVERILAFHAIGRVDPVPYAEGWGAALAKARELERNRTADAERE